MWKNPKFVTIFNHFQTNIINHYPLIIEIIEKFHIYYQYYY